jgi:hypothetical protein
MITRKALIAAFETIMSDSTIKTVTVFCPNRPAVPTFRMQRVRVTAEYNGKRNGGYRVTVGRMNYAERKYVERQISKTRRTPKIWIVYKKKGKK